MTMCARVFKTVLRGKTFTLLRLFFSNIPSLKISLNKLPSLKIILNKIQSLKINLNKIYFKIVDLVSL